MSAQYLTSQSSPFIGCPDPNNPQDPLAYLLEAANDVEYTFRVTSLERTEGLLNDSECEAAIEILQNAYNGHGIFFVWDRKVGTYSSKTDYFHAININVYSSGVGGGNAFSVPSTIIEIDKDVLFSPVIIHEMGHCLGLLHVHNDSEGDTDADAFTPTCEELVVPPNSDSCIECGDCICETNAISNKNENASLDENGNCVYSNTDMDSQGNVYQPNENTWKNYMSYANGEIFEFHCQDRFVEEQINRIKLIIQEDPYLNRVRIYSSFEEIPSTHDLICLNIDNDILIKNNDEDVKIAANTSPNLIGSSEIAVFGNHEISIEENTKVVIEGMKIYNPIDDKWKGIRVRGNGIQDDSYGLEMFSGCTLSGADIGISQNAGSLGGFIGINTTDFQSCGIGIEVMDDLDGDPISITSCNFNDGIFGVTSLNNDITIDHCTFTDIDNAGIRGIGSSITVEGHGGYLTNFTDCKYGIRLSWPNGQSKSTEIFNNVFDDNIYDVFVTGGSSDFPENRTNFTNNESSSSKISFIARGENNFTLLQNTFTNSGFSNFISNSGEEENQITLNEFNNSNYGDVLTSDNLLTLFSANCYSNQTFADVYISGTIPDQGTQTTAPGNCFTGGSVDELKTSNSTDNFTYYVPEQGISGYQSCHEVNSSGNYQILDAEGVVNNSNCGASMPYPLPPGGITGHSPCNPKKNEADLYQAIDDINDLIDEISNNTLFSQDAKDNLIAYYKRCLRKVKLWLIKELIANGKQNVALDSLRNDRSFYMQIKGYNLLVVQEDYPAADQYLNSLNPTRTEQYNYLYAQNVYLDHLIDKNYIPNNSALSTLHQYGNVDNVLSGSIRAIYEYFTGEFIELDVTVEGYNPIIPRRPESLKKGSEFKIYPNPVYSHDAIKVELPSNLAVNPDLNVVIKNINGQSLLVEKVKSNIFDVDVSSLDSGMYFFIIREKNGKILELEKIVLL